MSRLADLAKHLVCRRVERVLVQDPVHDRQRVRAQCDKDEQEVEGPERELRASEERYRYLFENSPISLREEGNTEANNQVFGINGNAFGGDNIVDHTNGDHAVNEHVDLDMALTTDSIIWCPMLTGEAPTVAGYCAFKTEPGGA